MDPNATLAELRGIMTAFGAAQDDADSVIEEDDAYRAAELFAALDGWIMKGGFLPTDWTKK